MKTMKFHILAFALTLVTINLHAQNNRDRENRNNEKKSQNSAISTPKNNQVKQGEAQRKSIGVRSSAENNQRNTPNVQPESKSNRQPSVVGRGNAPESKKQGVVNQNRSRAVQKDAVRHQAKGYDYGKDDFGRTYPTIGISINTLPGNPRQLRMNNNLYFEVRGVFYIQIGGNHQYQVVRPPVGAVVYDLPAYAEEVIIDGYVYYRYGDVYYAAIVLDNGYVAYEVVG